MDVSLRPIRPADAFELARKYAALSPETQYRRFLAPKPRLSARDLRYLTEVDGVDHVALVATPADDPDTILAVGRWVRLADRPDAAEFAIVVGDRWQRRGIGRRLAVALGMAARANGVRHLTASVLADNVASRRLIETITDHLEEQRHVGPVDELTYALAA